MDFSKTLSLLLASLVMIYAQVDYDILDRRNMRIVQNVSVLNSEDVEMVRMMVNLTVWGEYSPVRDTPLISNFMADKFAYIMNHPEEVFNTIGAGSNSTPGSEMPMPLSGRLMASEFLYVGQGDGDNGDMTPSTTLELTIDISSSDPSQQTNLTLLSHVKAML